jgi:dTDP-4-amino-4,6-dideoxygalactose transaminase
MSIPYLRLQAEYQALRDDWLSSIDAAGASGAFILGPNVRAFEEAAAAWLGARFGIGLANGTDALELALLGLGIGPGDEVITSPFTFFATAEAISKIGAIPVFADIEAESFNLDPVSVEQKIGPKTRALLPVHIFGHPARMADFRALADSHSLKLVEDCAQAFGAQLPPGKVGTLGDAGCFSFYPTKVLGCYGDGGFISTNDEALRDRLLKLRNHGTTAPFTHDSIGFNSRLDEIQAALLRLKLKKIDLDIAERERVARRYDQLLAASDAITPSRPTDGRHVYNLYTIRHPRRDALRAALNEAGIGNSQCYPKGLHLQAVYTSLGYRPGDLPVTDRICTETLSLPIYPDLRDDEIDRICELVRSI